MATFVDTSVWYAAVNKSDADRDIARSILSEHESSLVTSDHVLVELWNLANVQDSPFGSEPSSERDPRFADPESSAPPTTIFKLPSRSGSSLKTRASR